MSALYTIFYPQLVFISWVMLRRRQYLDYIVSNGKAIDEFERIWEEAIVVKSRSYPEICLEGLKKRKHE
jgi:hypothetical protein